MKGYPRIEKLSLSGYKVFGSTDMGLAPLQVVAGSNGSGKTSLLTFLKFLRYGMENKLPPEIIPNTKGQQIFSDPTLESITWNIQVSLGGEEYLAYVGMVSGPKGQQRVIAETVDSIDLAGNSEFTLLNTEFGPELINDDDDKLNFSLDDQRLVLGVVSPYRKELIEIRSFILDWRFFNSLELNGHEMRRPAILEQDAALNEDGGNLSSVLHYLITEHPDIYRELESTVKLAIPGFAGLEVKARGGPGEVLAFWKEDHARQPLTLADVSDGTLRFLCWAVLCLHPKPPALICIDEPELGLHPRVLPILAGLMQKASERTQLLVTTHSSYFLSLFELPEVVVMYKKDGVAQWVRPADVQTLTDILEEFGPEEMEALHRSDELEKLS